MATEEMEAMYHRLMEVFENVKIAEKLEILSPKDLRTEHIKHFNLSAPDNASRKGWFWTMQRMPDSWEREQDATAAFKPSGKWFCPGKYDWEERCIEMDMEFLYPYSEERVLGKRVLTVTTATEYQLFRYQFPKGLDEYTLDWKDVAKRYDGIEINFGLSCVYADQLFPRWDLSSGCIWRQPDDSDDEIDNDDVDENTTTHAMISGPPKTNRARSITNPRRNRFII
jgi:hypothetical protein